MDLNFIFGAILIVMILFLFYMLFVKIPRHNKEVKQRMIEQDVTFSKALIHLSGHPYLQPKDICSLQIRNNREIYFYRLNVDTGAEIPVSSLIKYEVKTETEIQKDVTLARLVALGIFAFGVKKKTVIEDHYLILTYMQKGVEITCVFKQHGKEQLGDIVSTFNRIRIESSAE